MYSTQSGLEYSHFQTLRMDTNSSVPRFCASRWEKTLLSQFHRNVGSWHFLISSDFHWAYQPRYVRTVQFNPLGSSWFSGYLEITLWWRWDSLKNTIDLRNLLQFYYSYSSLAAFESSWSHITSKISLCLIRFRLQVSYFSGLALNLNLGS